MRDHTELIDWETITWAEYISITSVSNTISEKGI